MDNFPQWKKNFARNLDFREKKFQRGFEIFRVVARG